MQKRKQFEDDDRLSEHEHEEHEHKTRQRQHKRSNSPVPLPDVINVDVLAMMSEVDLIARLRSLEEARLKAYNAQLELRPWEEEIAYVKREQQIRRIRHDKYEEYLREVEEELERAEANLPAGDFDNTAFVHAANCGRTRRNFNA